ncbi:MAG: chemotaxis response regulator protein-glutamate methylesterase [Candidatus Atribacteria bacterium]|nr:chemotaxis response regulator protein-glutamate methylesterase [Candidatus Atribacteria bacterium]MCD6349308.1 chemotaxis response regulator protein-glutamate methylesterase [Candidatus Atribacteria bacterium]
MRKIEAMVVDDSAFMRRMIGDILERAGIEVIAVARDGVEALKKLDEVTPDVILLDVEMPRMNGLTFLDEAMRKGPYRVVMLSALTGEGSQCTIEALERGALDFVQKPSGSISLDIEKKAAEIVEKVKAVVDVPLEKLRDLKALKLSSGVTGKVEKKKIAGGGVVAEKLLFVASSTGGPRALKALFANLQNLKKSCVVIVQHMPAGFTAQFARYLNDLSPFPVVEASGGEKTWVNWAFLAPGGKHLFLKEDKSLVLGDDPPVAGLKPCADLALLSAVKAFGKNILAVVLTGMGKDALEGCRAVKSAGGKVIAESRESALIFGMPGAVVKEGLADWVLSLDEIPQIILEWDEA